MQINFHTNREDFDQIKLIVDRAETLASEMGAPLRKEDRRYLWMDISACHANGCPLRLADLLAADRFDFVHDVWGIMRHLDRTTGKLGDCFVPRFAAIEEAVS